MRQRLAEAEVEYAEKTSPSIDVRFTVVDKIDFWNRFDHTNKGRVLFLFPSGRQRHGHCLQTKRSHLTLRCNMR